MKIWPGILVCLAVASASSAQVRPQSNSGDPRLQTVDYDAKQVVQLEGVPGYELMVELSPDEQIVNVAVGDSSAWQVNVNQAGDRFFIKPTQASGPTNMTVITTVRTYNFELYPRLAPGPDTAFNVQFRYPPPRADTSVDEYVDVSPLRRAMSRYRISGDRSLRPDSISDDGEHTYISWPRSKPIPAVYTISDGTAERLITGWMRNDVYVIDEIVDRLTFKIDARSARADRLPPRKRR